MLEQFSANKYSYLNQPQSLHIAIHDKVEKMLIQ
jgi:hypothetical protein